MATTATTTPTQNKKEMIVFINDDDDERQQEQSSHKLRQQKQIKTESIEQQQQQQQQMEQKPKAIIDHHHHSNDMDENDELISQDQSLTVSKLSSTSMTTKTTITTTTATTLNFNHQMNCCHYNLCTDDESATTNNTTTITTMANIGINNSGADEPLTPSDYYEFYPFSTNSNGDDENKKQKSKKMIDPSSSIINTIRRTSAESYIGSYQKRSLLSEHLFVEPLIIVNDASDNGVNNNDNDDEQMNNPLNAATTTTTTTTTKNEQQQQKSTTTTTKKRHSISVSNLQIFANSLLTVASFADAKSSQFISYLKNGCQTSNMTTGAKTNDNHDNDSGQTISEHSGRSSIKMYINRKKRDNNNQQKKPTTKNDSGKTLPQPSMTLQMTDDKCNTNDNKNNGQRKSSKNRNYFSKFHSKSKTTKMTTTTTSPCSSNGQNDEENFNESIQNNNDDENYNSSNSNSNSSLDHHHNHPNNNNNNNEERKDSIVSSSSSSIIMDYGFQGKIIRAHLPDDQRTIVSITPGQTIRDVLEKSMYRRKLTSDICTVYLCDSNEPIDWNTDVSLLYPGAEIRVKTNEPFQTIQTRISHNYIRKTFFTLEFCECCNRILFHGFRCQTCGIRFHTRCALQVPSLCQPLRIDNYYRHLLAMNANHQYPTGGNMVTRDGSFYHSSSVNNHHHLHQQKCKNTFHPNQTSSIKQQQRQLNKIEIIKTVNDDDDDNDQLINQSEAVNQLSPNFLRPDLQTQQQQQQQQSQQQHSRERSTSAPNVCFNSTAIIIADNDGSKHPPPQQTAKIHSATTSPTNPIQTNDSTKIITTTTTATTTTTTGSTINNNGRPRARSADESVKKIKINQHNNHGLYRESIEDWEIPQDEILVGPRIGSGSYGTVYRGHWHGPVALKKLKVAEPTQTQLQEFKNELTVLRKTRHVNIILFMGCVSKPHLTIVTQWCEGSSLYKHLHVIETNFDIIQLIEIARQTAQGMDYLHAKHIIHRDLKSNNIFLHNDFTVKIGDFGLATVKSQWKGSQKFQQPTGSVLWMAPEIIRMIEPNPYSFQSDVYSYGIVLYELTSGTLPYRHINNKDQILFMVGRGYLRPDLSLIRDNIPKRFSRLLNDCIQFDHCKRPLFRQILSRIENIMQLLPKFDRSRSEPSIHHHDNNYSSLSSSIDDPDLIIFNDFIVATTTTTTLTTTTTTKTRTKPTTTTTTTCCSSTTTNNELPFSFFVTENI
ncbi:serine/threonine-protein kinase a-raf-like isoform x4 [Dermatophagoides farinae]|uniref:non-specific serine/threonine protein kinase n=1 Tax=Dermatophagoides farinae TaxID=6954 RepID=A0A9D4P724_DERFA|nr:M-phase inducer phosphatase-like [Dermatophagoides farinae]KAH7645118.1 serine/threonine-protein kinase a-raf-like isoform x4 [Dermatophagoides farinae]